MRQHGVDAAIPEAAPLEVIVVTELGMARGHAGLPFDNVDIGEDLVVQDAPLIHAAKGQVQVQGVIRQRRFPSVSR